MWSQQLNNQTPPQQFNQTPPQFQFNQTFPQQYTTNSAYQPTNNYSNPVLYGQSSNIAQQPQQPLPGQMSQPSINYQPIHGIPNPLSFSPNSSIAQQPQQPLSGQFPQPNINYNKFPITGMPSQNYQNPTFENPIPQKPFPNPQIPDYGSPVQPLYSLSPFQNSNEDAESVNRMVLAAKLGEWETVWEILDEKPHIVNCIPKDRAWSALHQAVWLNNKMAVQKLLSYPDCDPEIRTKQDRDGIFGPKKRPIDLAESQEIKNILIHKSYQNSIHPSDLEEKITLVSVNEFGKPLGSCIYLTLICCKGYLISQDCDINEIKISALSQVMKLIHGYVCIGNNWIAARDNVSLTLQQYSIELGNKLWTGNLNEGVESIELLSDDKKSFFIRAISLYTEECRKLHKALNNMLRHKTQKPSSLELSLGPYALLLNSILMEWNALIPYQGTTYRTCDLTEGEADEYKPGIQFVWLNFSSSSKIEPYTYTNISNKYLFVIDNSFSPKWAPREIMQHSEFFSEQECLYAFGSMFIVTSFDKFSSRIYLKLIDY